MAVTARGSRWAQRQVLASNALFADLPPERIAALAEACRLVDYPAHSRLYAAGETIGEAFLLVRGSVRRFAASDDEAGKLLDVPQAGQLLGLAELFAGDRYQVSCQAIGDCLVLAIDRQALKMLADSDPLFSRALLAALARAHCRIELDIAGRQAGATGAQKLLDYLVTLAGDELGPAGETTVQLKTSKKLIAARLGMTPETFSRCLRLLTDSGAIVVDGRKIHLQHAALIERSNDASTRPLAFPRKTRGEQESQRRPLSQGAVINLCGRQRLLSQRMAQAWAMEKQRIASVRSAARLREARAQFEHNLARLQPLAPKRIAQECLIEVSKEWRSFLALVFAGGEQVPRPEEIFSASETLLAACDRLTSSAVLLAGTPEAGYVNVAGRNRVLSQRIVKSMLFEPLLQEDDAAADIPQQVRCPSVEEFERNLATLRNGSRAIPELLAQLDAIETQWRRLLAILNPDLASVLQRRQLSMVASEGERLLRHLDTAVKLYERLAR